MDYGRRGSRDPRNWWLPGALPDEGGGKRALRKEGRVVGRCRICGKAIRSGESYHITGVGMTHLRCEWRKG